MSDSPRLTAKSLAVLKLMLEKPTQGFSGAEITRLAGIGSGTLYPLLARLESSGWLKSEWEVQAASNLGRPRQRFYRLTAIGKNEASKALSNLRVTEGALVWAR